MEEYILEEIKKNIEDLKSAKNWYGEIVISYSINSVLTRCESMVSLLEKQI